MPTLDWIGKQAVVNHHKDVPYRLLHCDSKLSVGDPDSGNLLVQGDNLEALKALLPYYRGQVNCIFIDPPYNTGNEGWQYNDNVNSPEIRQWLKKTVGKEGEDLSRHDKWLCMMYPRLRLLHEFLAEDGSFWMTLDDNEAHSGKLLLDEIFGQSNFVANVIWQKKYSPQNDAKYFSDNHDHIFVYAKSKEIWRPIRLPRTQEQNARYINPDNDARGPWKPGDLSVKTYSANYDFEIKTPSGRLVNPPPGRSWRTDPKGFKKLLNENRIWFGENGSNVPAIKRFLSEVRDGVTPLTIWLYSEVSHNQEARRVLSELGLASHFETPKPVQLIDRILKLATNSDAIILDSFAGSGTTAHAVLEANAKDAGNRKFILCELYKDIADGVTAKRLASVINGYDKNGDSTKPVSGLGGGFRYCHLGTKLFNEFGDIDHLVTFPALAAHIFFSETGSPLPKRVDGTTPFIGQYQNRLIYLLFSAANQDFAREAAQNVLTPDRLSALPEPPDGFSGATRVVYAEGCTVTDEHLAECGVVSKQIPYQIEGV